MSDLPTHGHKTNVWWYDLPRVGGARTNKNRLARNRRRAEPGIIAEQMPDPEAGMDQDIYDGFGWVEFELEERET